jgi:hypothetical protein
LEFKPRSRSHASSRRWLVIGQNDELLFKMAQFSTNVQAEANRLVTTRLPFIGRCIAGTFGASARSSTKGG